MKNFITKGNVFEYVAGAAVSSGDIIAMGDVIGVAATDGVIGDTIAVNVCGVYEVAKAAGVAIAQGAKLYHVAADDTLTNTDNAGANKFAGYAYEAALAGDAVVRVKLNF